MSSLGVSCDDVASEPSSFGVRLHVRSLLESLDSDSPASKLNSCTGSKPLKLDGVVSGNRPLRRLRRCSEMSQPPRKEGFPISMSGIASRTRSSINLLEVDGETFISRKKHLGLKGPRNGLDVDPIVIPDELDEDYEAVVQNDWVYTMDNLPVGCNDKGMPINLGISNTKSILDILGSDSETGVGKKGPGPNLDAQPKLSVKDVVAELGEGIVMEAAAKLKGKMTDCDDCQDNYLPDEKDVDDTFAFLMGDEAGTSIGVSSSFANAESSMDPEIISFAEYREGILTMLVTVSNSIVLLIKFLKLHDIDVPEYIPYVEGSETDPLRTLEVPMCKELCDLGKAINFQSQLKKAILAAGLDIPPRDMDCGSAASRLVRVRLENERLIEGSKKLVEDDGFESQDIMGIGLANVKDGGRVMNNASMDMRINMVKSVSKPYVATCALKDDKVLNEGYGSEDTEEAPVGIELRIEGINKMVENEAEHMDLQTDGFCANSDMNVAEDMKDRKSVV